MPPKTHEETILRYAKKTVAEQRKAGRPAIPDDQKRGKNAVKIYLNDSELDALRMMVGRGNGASDFVRNLIMREWGKTAPAQEKRELVFS